MYKKNLVFAAACMGMLLFGIELITLGSLAPDIKLKFQLDEIAAGTLFSILPFGILLGSLVFGPIADRFGYKWLLVISCLGFFAGFEGIAFSDSIQLLRVCIFMIGLFGGVINGATNAVVADITTNQKGANLSLLGVFFGIGALGMPFVLAMLKPIYSFERIIAFTGLLIALVAIFYSAIQFPRSKKAEGFPLANSKQLFREPFLILVGFFLFFQSSYEALVNNWTTSFLSTERGIDKQKALLALSLSVAGLTLMRFLLGTVLRSLSARTTLIVSFCLLAIANVLLISANDYAILLIALVSMGMGLAGGFPVLLGLVAEKYADRSGTAFSFVLLFALTGNMLLNYAMGQIAARWGIDRLPMVLFIELGLMCCLFIFIFQLVKKNKVEIKASIDI
jgi:FHS family glucose/mannose:H+ symporter-like MFS transporter